MLIVWDDSRVQLEVVSGMNNLLISKFNVNYPHLIVAVTFVYGNLTIVGRMPL